MNNKEDNFKEKFKKALISTAKVISGDYKLNLDSKDKNSSSKNLDFFELDNLENIYDFIRLRAETDSKALEKKFSNKEIYQKNLPNNTSYKTLYDISEKIRFELLGAKILQGVSKNLNNAKGKEKVTNMIKVASLTRRGFIAGDISTVMSPRTVLNWVSNSQIFSDTGYAFRVTFLNKCDEAEKNIIAEYYQRCFGEDLPESMINIQI